MIKAYSGGGSLTGIKVDQQTAGPLSRRTALRSCRWQVAACALSIIVDYSKFGDNHNYQKITGNETFSTHDPDGDVLYGIELFVHPKFRGMRLGRRLYDARKELCENLNLRSIVAGGRSQLQGLLRRTHPAPVHPAGKAQRNLRPYADLPAVQMTSMCGRSSRTTCRRTRSRKNMLRCWSGTTSITTKRR